MSGSGAVHVTTQRRHYTGKDGRERVYETHLLRRSWREGGKVRNETVANLSKLPAETIELIRRSLAGERFVPAGQQALVARSLPHGHVAAVHAMARKLGFPALLGPACRERDLAFAMVVSRVARPASKLSTINWWHDTTLGGDLGVAGASTDEVYEAMDWKVIVLLGAILPLGIALDKTGLAQHIVDGGMSIAGPHGPLAVLVMVYLVTALLTEMMGHNPSVVLMVPISISVAHVLNASPIPFVITVAFAAATSGLVAIPFAR